MSLATRLKSYVNNSNSALLGAAGTALHRVASNGGSSIPDARINLVFALSQPSDPLKKSLPLAPIDVVIPMVEKDLTCLPLVLSGVDQFCTNPITRIRIVTPRGKGGNGPILTSPARKKQWSRLREEWPKLTVEFDDEVLGKELWSAIRERKTHGWNIQQLIKFSAVLTSPELGTLVLDADTVLTQPKSWLDSRGRQLLQVGQVVRPFYTQHFTEFFGFSKSVSAGFITHHQLMQREILEEMFPQGERDLIRWLDLAESSPRMKLSEYDTYGTYLSSKHADRTRFGSWANLSASELHQALEAGIAQAQLATVGRDYASVSFHSYHFGNGTPDQGNDLAQVRLTSLS